MQRQFGEFNTLKNLKKLRHWMSTECQEEINSGLGFPNPAHWKKSLGLELLLRNPWNILSYNCATVYLEPWVIKTVYANSVTYGGRLRPYGISSSSGGDDWVSKVSRVGGPSLQYQPPIIHIHILRRKRGENPGKAG